MTGSLEEFVPVSQCGSGHSQGFQPSRGLDGLDISGSGIIGLD